MVRILLAVLACLPLALCSLHRLELGNFADHHKLRYNAATPEPRPMSLEEIRSELHSVRQRRSSGPPVSNRFQFNDTHSSGIIVYSGTDQKVQEPRGSVLA